MKKIKKNNLPKITICILTYNGEKYLNEVLKSIFNQKIQYSYEVLIIDSGSTDKTLSIIKKFPSVKLKKIKNSEFGHGKTRNLAIKLAKGEFIVFLTQDATPTSNKWLYELIKPFYKDQDIVATYGKHIPRKDAPPFIKKDIEEFFNSLTNSNNNLIQKIEINKNYNDFDYGRLTFFSDVNCTLRKSFVNLCQYENVNYAEDQLMGKKIIEKGLTKVYVPKAAVYHSHNYPIFNYLLRYFDEYKGLKKTIGFKDKITIKNILIETLKGGVSDIKYLFKLRENLLYKIKWIFPTFIYNFERRLAALLVKNEEKIPKIFIKIMSMEYWLKKINYQKNKMSNQNHISWLNYFNNKLKKLLFIYNKYGFPGVKKLFIGFFLKIFGIYREIYTIDNDKNFFWDYIEKVDLNNPPKLKTHLKIKRNNSKYVLNWIIPYFGIGSGGHMTIFRIINFLENNGYINNIYMLEPIKYKNAAIIKDTIDKYFIKINAKVYIGTEYMKDSDAIIATSWHTAYAAFNIINTRKKIYLVQDFEPSFYPMGSEYIFAENTYKMGYKCICASQWLAHLLKKNYGCNAEYFNLAFDENIYFPKDIKRDKKTICFYARPVTSRRGFELGILALNKVKKEIPDVEIILFGWNEDYKLPFKYKNLGILSEKKLADLYRKSTLGLVISTTNISIIPFEMAACKLPIVSNKHPSLLDVFKDKEEIILADNTPDSLANKIIYLLKNEELRKKIADKVYNKISNLKFINLAKKIEKFLNKELC